MHTKHLTKRRKKNIENKQMSAFRAALLLPSLLWIIICIIGLFIPEFFATVNYDLGENRNLSAFPSTFSNDYCAKLEEYYDDHLPFRSVLISTNDKLKYMVEKPYEKGIRDGLVAFFHNNEKETTITNTETKETTTEQIKATTTESLSPVTIFPIDISDSYGETEPVPSAEDTQQQTESYTETEAETEDNRYYPTAPTDAVDTDSFFAPVVKNDYVIVGRGDWLFMYGSGNINYYLGNNILSDEQMQTYVDALDMLDSKCTQAGKQLVILIPPNKDQVYSEYMPSYEIENEYKRVPRLVDYIHSHSKIALTYPLDDLINAKAYYMDYMKYDSHWNEAGAFIAYQKVLGLLGMQTTDILDLATGPVLCSGGDLIASGSLNAADYQNDYFYNINYKLDISPLATEGTIGQTYSYYKVKSDVECKKKLAVIGDSFRNHLAIFSYKDFAESTFIHVYMLGDSSADEVILDSDIVLLVYCERNDEMLLSTANYLINLLS